MAPELTVLCWPCCFGACAAGGLGLLVVLTLFATKRELYMMPAFPFAAMLAAYIAAMLIQ